MSTRSKRGRVSGGGEDEPKLGGKPPQKPLPKKPLRKPPRLPPKSTPTKEMVRDWNKTARIGFKSETAKGWLKKMERKRNAQGRVLRWLKPGAGMLREIQFYQRCQTFLTLSRLLYPLRVHINIILSSQAWLIIISDVNCQYCPKWYELTRNGWGNPTELDRLT